MKGEHRNGSAKAANGTPRQAKSAPQQEEGTGSKRSIATRKQGRELRLHAIEVRQGPKRTLYSFAIDGKTLSEFTTVSRVRRQEAAAIEGYQRPEVLSHIAEIRDYLETDDPMIPNAVVVAFDRRVRFEPASP